MHIFLDESGTFSRGQRSFSPSTVGGVVIPDGTVDRLMRRYTRLRHRLPKEGGEVKGRLLNEQQIADVLDLVRQSNGLFEAVSIDPQWHQLERFHEHRELQANALTVGLTSQHHTTLHTHAHRLADQLRSMSEPQYLQAQCTFQLLAQLPEIAINYYAIRQPKELAQFRWVFDAKERDKTTKWEDWWSTVMLPWLESHSVHTPARMFVGGDFRHFEKFQMDVPDHIVEAGSKKRGTDLGLLMENLRFSSGIEPGLEIADIAVNALRRSLMGHVQQPAWAAIRSLTVHRSGGCLRLATLSGTQQRMPSGLSPAVRYLTRGGRNMLTPAIYASK